MDRYADLQLLNYVGFGHGTVTDWVGVLAFFMIAAFYFLSPMMGYTRKPDLMLSALYVILGMLGIGFIQLFVTFLMTLDSRSPGNWYGMAAFGFALLKAVAFIIALFLFTLSLGSLRNTKWPVPENSNAH